MPPPPHTAMMETLLSPIVEIWGLMRSSISLRAELARREASLRIRKMAMAVVFLFAAVALLILALVIGVKTGLIGLMVLGLSPFYAHLLTFGLCILIVILLLLGAKSSLTRAFGALTPLTAPEHEAGLPGAINTKTATATGTAAHDPR